MDEHGNWHGIATDDIADAIAKKAAEQQTPLGSKAMLMLEIGEVVEIRGEKFRVRKITKKDVILRSVRT